MKRAMTAAKLRIFNQELLLISVSTGKLYKYFGKQLLGNYIAKENRDLNPLFHHEITPRMRSRMVDWIVECFKIYNRSEETFFHAVAILDNYLHKTPDILNDTDIHLLGI
jgi:hypothetical protein